MSASPDSDKAERNKGSLDLQIKRIYDDPSTDDGTRILIDRLWPRGVSREKARVDKWDKDLAPSDQLRKWFGPKSDRFDEFARRYRAELQSQSRRLSELRALARESRVTLLYAAKDSDHNNAVVLTEALRRGLPRSGRPS